MVSSQVDSAMVIANHHALGSSTGHFTKLRGDWPSLVNEAMRTSTLVAELAALSEPEFLELCAWLEASANQLPFKFLSLHAPTKSRTLAEEDLVSRLTRLPQIVSSIVVHPDQIEVPARFQGLGGRLVIENMDRRKAGGQTADELQMIFQQLPEAGFCFDIAHAHSIDPTMKEAHTLLDAYADRLRHVHLSSLDSCSHHVPLSRDDRDLFAPVLQRCCDVPWILEAPLN